MKDMSIIIGSFNLYKFGGESDEKSAKNFMEIARIIKDEKFDIIALQEVFSKDRLEKTLMPYLGNKYTMIYQDSHGKEISYREGYAFIWKKDKYEIQGNEEGEVYKRHGAKRKLVRPPFAARFIPLKEKGGFVEIRLINTHMVFGKPSHATGSDAEYRREELKILTEEVYPRIADKRYGNNRPAYTILMGDYNLCISESPKVYSESGFIRSDQTGLKKTEEYVEIPIQQGLFSNYFDREKRVIRIAQHEKTSLKRPVNDKESSEHYDVDSESNSEQIIESGELDYYSKDYDHFSYDATRFKDIGVIVERVDALKKYYGNDLEKYRHEVSDHVPIKITIDFRGRGGN